MACGSFPIKGLVNQCDSSLGGVKNVWIAIYADDLALSYNTDGDVITGVTAGTAIAWHKYYVKKNVASFTSTQTIDQANGSNYVTTELSLVFNKIETVKRVEMTALGLNDLMVIVEDNNGLKWFLGKDNAVNVSAGTAETGTAMGDANRYTLTLQDISATYPFEVSSDVVLP